MTTLFKIKACIKCGGDLHLQRDHYGSYLDCVQCGSIFEAQPAETTPPGHCRGCGNKLYRPDGQWCVGCMGRNGRQGNATAGGYKPQRSDTGQARHGRTNPDYDPHASRQRGRGLTVQGHYQSK